MISTVILLGGSIFESPRVAGQIEERGRSDRGETQTFDYRKCGRIVDPEGNKVEFREPNDKAESAYRLTLLCFSLHEILFF